jgi:hypothetical protein
VNGQPFAIVARIVPGSGKRVKLSNTRTPTNEKIRGKIRGHPRTRAHIGIVMLFLHQAET